MTNPHTTATKSATTEPAATNATRRFVGGLELNGLLPELGVLQRALDRRRELIHEQAQARAPTRRDVVVQSDHFMIVDGRDLGESRPLGHRDRKSTRLNSSHLG